MATKFEEIEEFIKTCEDVQVLMNIIDSDLLGQYVNGFMININEAEFLEDLIDNRIEILMEESLEKFFHRSNSDLYKEFNLSGN